MDIEKQRARWRRGQATYRKTEKYKIARARYKATDGFFIAQHLRFITPENRLKNRISMQERRNALKA